MPLSDYFTAPTSYRLNQQLSGLSTRTQDVLTGNTAGFFHLNRDHSGHPDFGHLTLLVFEAVLEVVCVSLPGYIVARQGMFDAESQKFLANLNVQLFTPCLIFTKLASQLTADKLAELAIIPIIFVVQTFISYMCAWLFGTLMRFKKRQKNFVIAMGVFGNSNSLPISLVLSLSKTLKGLHWAKIPGDNDDEVAARGILYLLIFQQLGQLVRWTWGYNVLLAPADKYSEEDGGTARAADAERGRGQYRDEVDDADHARLLSPPDSDGYDSADFDDDSTRVPNSPVATSRARSPKDTGKSSSSQSMSAETLAADAPDLLPTPANGNIAPHNHNGDQPELYKVRKLDEEAAGLRGVTNRIKNRVTSAKLSMKRSISRVSTKAFRCLPVFLQKTIKGTASFVGRFFRGLWEFMNPPLWAMLIAIIVASVPDIQHLFFNRGSFVRNSVTRAIEQSGGVAVPLILVVLGGNLARNTLPKGDRPGEMAEPAEERKLLIASIVSRMIIPTVVMAPLLALTAKFVPVSILDDKIFIIVCFLLTGAPTALQLAQICQINNVYMGVMSSILFQSYVIWILPSTLVLVLLALETNEWAES